jgi:hypothetical protein
MLQCSIKIGQAGLQLVAIAPHLATSLLELSLEASGVCQLRSLDLKCYRELRLHVNGQRA